MNSIKKIVVPMITLALTTAFFGARESILLPEAHAVVGRPATPVSYAGVARRTTRGAAYTGAAAGYGYSYSHPSTPVYVDYDDDYDDDADYYGNDDCTVTVNAYGNMQERCED